MHRIYHSDGIVLGGSPFGEANRFLYILTRDLGLVRASAQSVRGARSKLRMNVQDFSYCRFALVRGRKDWKVTSAIEHRNFFYRIKDSPLKLRILVSLATVLRRLVAGEETNRELFAIVYGIFSYLEAEPGLTADPAHSRQELIQGDERLRNAECIAMARILNNLGYLKQNQSINQILRDSGEFPAIKKAWRLELISEINRSLKESQL